MNVRKAQELILFLCAGSLLSSLFITNEVLSIVLVGLLLLLAITTLYYHMGHLTRVSDNNPKMYTMRKSAVFSALILAICLVASYLSKTNRLSENREKFFTALAVLTIIIVVGNISPKLPFNRHIGLRLPWTVSDEETWIVAHRITGNISFPLAVAYSIAIPVINDFELLSGIIILLWVAIPGGFSCLFYYRKIHGKL